jgi:dTDP-4-dehydrorhamnose reductase
MRILLLGHTGQLGWELHRSLAPLGEVTALDYPQIDLAVPSAVRVMIKQITPELIVNATAYTEVDQAEHESSLAYAVNADGPAILAEEAKRLHAALVHFSTDYVFDGQKGAPLTEDDQPNPLNVYGKSKLDGELAVQQLGGAYLIFRTSWVYSLRRDSFVTKVLSWARQHRVLRLVSDQISGPTWSRMLAEITAQVLVKGIEDINQFIEEYSGLYHLAGEGYASRLEWGQLALSLDPRRIEQIVEDIKPVSTDFFPSPARRPLFSALNCQRFYNTFGFRLPPWQEALHLAMQVEEAAGR